MTRDPSSGLSSSHPSGPMTWSKKYASTSTLATTRRKHLHKGKVSVTLSSPIHVNSSSTGSPTPGSPASPKLAPYRDKYEARFLAIGKERYFPAKVVLRGWAIH